MLIIYIITKLCYNSRMVFFYNVTTVVEAKHQIILRRSTMDRMTVYDRLELFATNGLVGCDLNLYERQIEKLVRGGLAVQRGLPVAGWKGQYRCKIGWRYAVPHTMAWHLLQLAAENNEKLRQALANPEYEESDSTHSNGWIIPD